MPRTAWFYATCLLAIDAGLAMQMLKFKNRSFGKCVLAGVPRTAALRQAQRDSKVRCNSLAWREQHGDSGWSSERSYGWSPRRSPRLLASSSHPPAGSHVGGLTTTFTLGPSYAPKAATPGRCPFGVAVGIRASARRPELRIPQFHTHTAHLYPILPGFPDWIHWGSELHVSAQKCPLIRSNGRRGNTQAGAGGEPQRNRHAPGLE
jgi:hypothetical protein